MPRVHLLGPVALTHDDIPADLGGSRSRAVFAVLALHAGRAVQRHELIDAVWGADAPKTAANQLQIAVHRVRAALGEAGHRLLRLEPGGYVLDLADTDLAVFRRYAAEGAAAARHGDWPGARECFHAALAGWRGALAADVDAPGLVAARAAVDEERLTVLEHRMVADLVTGHAAPVLAGTAAPGLRERLWHLRVLAVAMESGTAAARDEHARATAVLTGATGLDPGHGFRALGESLGDTTRAVGAVRSWIVGDAAALRPRPMELPAGIRDFVGRRDELARLAEVLAEGGTAVVVGMGGAGKTSLAVRAAREAAALYPDGCLFTDLRGADDEPREPHAVLGSFLRSLGVPNDAIPATLAERAALYRSMAARRRLLVVLDNALNAAQLTDLLPGTAVIVTSRNALDVGGTSLTLGMLSEGEAADLVGRFVEDAGSAADVGALVAFTGRLPLALRIVAVRMSRRRDLGVSRMLARLADESSRLDELADGDRQVRSCIAIGYRRLSEPARAMLRAAGRLPVGEFSLGVLMGLTGLPLTLAADVAGELEAAQLLGCATDEPGVTRRFVLHDLVKVFAREESGDGERRAVLTRGLRALHAAAVCANEALAYWKYFPQPARDAPDPDIGDSVSAAPDAWFAAHRELLVTAVGVAAELGEAELAWGLTGATTSHLDKTAALEDRRAMVAAALPLRSRLTGVRLADALLISAKALVGTEREAEARALLRRARIGFRDAGDRLRAASVACEIAFLERRLTRQRVARAAAEWGLARLDGGARHVRGARGWLLLTLADISYLDRPERGFDLAEGAIAEMISSGDRVGRAMAMTIKGMAEVWMRRHDDAVADLTGAAERHLAEGDLSGWMTARRGTGDALANAGRFDEAIAVLSRLVTDAAAVGAKEQELRAKRLIASVQIVMGHHQDALPLAEEALAGMRDRTAPLLTVLCLRTVARAALGLGDLARVRSAHAEAMTLMPHDHPYADQMRALLTEADAGEPA
ncbi:regulatory protein AfsR [Actinorhabdospora filicis]|uniref:Regulatory protein AfsR n=1 Tax=Actinorhabdospora filicis TaxID=1785913 RepID=A0A9W6SQA0_9ACTN|nr:BTAD domain-containing putative transcriptional regulator [Actinorhabdospora filicis]GLZ80025.1 regulatory protein AfsR [Actinorhabdospora filicis]